MERRVAPGERRGCDRIPAVFAVKRALPHDREIQLCQAEDIAPAGMTIKRPRGSAVLPRTELALSFSLPGSREEISARGMVVTDASVGSFRRTGVRFIALRPEHAQLIAGYCRRPR
ncbi:MAG TPA: PilZ domain-containing protein [Polyangia bacterium]|nr:PilZ domain-containing protein [Polyangia bacterium]